METTDVLAPIWGMYITAIAIYLMALSSPWVEFYARDLQKITHFFVSHLIVPGNDFSVIEIITIPFIICWDILLVLFAVLIPMILLTIWFGVAFGIATIIFCLTLIALGAFIYSVIRIVDYIVSLLGCKLGRRYLIIANEILGWLGCKSDTQYSILNTDDSSPC